MRRLLLTAGLSVTLFGCATGTPVGGRTGMWAARHRAFTPPAAPRVLPRATSKPSPPAPVIAPALGPDEARAKVVAVARRFVGKPKVAVSGRTWPADCTGIVRAAFSSLGLDLLDEARAGDNAVTAIYRFAQERGRVFEAGRPMPGDLVFFRETYDLNRDGRLNDGLTHIGIVEDVDAEGTVTVIHRVARGVVRYRMNLANPDVRRDPASGRVYNDALRHAGPGRREVLTGQLFAGYATLLSPADPLARR